MTGDDNDDHILIQLENSITVERERERERER